MIIMVILMIIITKMTKKTYNYCEVWVKKCYFKDKYLVKKGAKRGMGRPPPPLFRQCPKENVFFQLRSSLTLKIKICHSISLWFCPYFCPFAHFTFCPFTPFPTMFCPPTLPLHLPLTWLFRWWWVRAKGQKSKSAKGKKGKRAKANSEGKPQTIVENWDRCIIWRDDIKLCHWFPKFPFLSLLSRLSEIWK